MVSESEHDNLIDFFVDRKSFSGEGVAKISLAKLHTSIQACSYICV